MHHVTRIWPRFVRCRQMFEKKKDRKNSWGKNRKKLIFWQFLGQIQYASFSGTLAYFCILTNFGSMWLSWSLKKMPMQKYFFFRKISETLQKSSIECQKCNIWPHEVIGKNMGKSNNSVFEISIIFEICCQKLFLLFFTKCWRNLR